MTITIALDDKTRRRNRLLIARVLRCLATRFGLPLPRREEIYNAERLLALQEQFDEIIRKDFEAARGAFPPHYVCFAGFLGHIINDSLYKELGPALYDKWRDETYVAALDPRHR